MRQLLHSFLLFTLFFFSCQPYRDYRFDGNLLYTLDMKEGSYWIFRDSLTHRLDTLKYKTIYWAYPTNRHSSNQIRNFEFSNEADTSSGTKINLNFHANAEYRTVSMNATYTIKDTISIKTGELLVYQEPFSVGRVRRFNDGYYENLGTYNVYELLSKQYLTVFQSGQFYMDTLQPYPNNIVWYSMHDKVIKLRMQTHERLVVLELIDHKIVR